MRKLLYFTLILIMLGHPLIIFTFLENTLVSRTYAQDDGGNGQQSGDSGVSQDISSEQTGSSNDAPATENTTPNSNPDGSNISQNVDGLSVQTDVDAMSNGGEQAPADAATDLSSQLENVQNNQTISESKLNTAISELSTAESDYLSGTYNPEAEANGGMSFEDRRDNLISQIGAFTEQRDSYGTEAASLTGQIAGPEAVSTAQQAEAAQQQQAQQATQETISAHGASLIDTLGITDIYDSRLSGIVDPSLSADRIGAVYGSWASLMTAYSTPAEAAAAAASAAASAVGSIPGSTTSSAAGAASIAAQTAGGSAYDQANASGAVGYSRGGAVESLTAYGATLNSTTGLSDAERATAIHSYGASLGLPNSQIGQAMSAGGVPKEAMEEKFSDPAARAEALAGWTNGPAVAAATVGTTPTTTPTQAVSAPALEQVAAIAPNTPTVPTTTAAQPPAAAQAPATAPEVGRPEFEIPVGTANIDLSRSVPVTVPQEAGAIAVTGYGNWSITDDKGDVKGHISWSMNGYQGSGSISQGKEGPEVGQITVTTTNSNGVTSTKEFDITEAKFADIQTNFDGIKTPNDLSNAISSTPGIKAK